MLRFHVSLIRKYNCILYIKTYCEREGSSRQHHRVHVRQIDGRTITSDKKLTRQQLRIKRKYLLGHPKKRTGW